MARRSDNRETLGDTLDLGVIVVLNKVPENTFSCFSHLSEMAFLVL